MTDQNPFLEDFYQSQREELDEELSTIQHEIDVFHEREDFDDIKHTFGDLLNRRDHVKRKIRELEK